MEDQPIIVAHNVCKTYKNDHVEVHALKGLDVEIARAEMVAIMGPSGCGKTTLLNSLSGLDNIDSGEVIIEGVPLHTMSDRQRTKYRARRMGFVFQFYNLLPTLSAIENVELPLLVSGVNAREARRRAIEVVKLLEIEQWMNHRPSELSGGQIQRFQIARALSNQPAIIWADEPTGNLDSDAALKVLALMQHINQTHEQTIVIVTHDEQIGAGCNRIIRMKDGQIVNGNH